ncbi:MAG: 2-C-methyl-D-erythritol 4-phosphate cytidylyltransferase [Oscillospiraceae bacterium]|nr:2-C-methyl-D-erythritol 4-phosphate cytidylyltransferase [Oscillospiraceae bacterium]
MRKACTAVVVAAGSARRMQGIDKIMADIGGKPILLRTAQALSESEKIDGIVIVTRAELVQEVRSLCADLPKLRAVVLGGESRAQSVLRGLDAVKTPLAAIHDGARPLVTREIIDAAIDAASDCGAAAPAVAVHDTIKVAKNGVVQSTPDRSTLFAVQTPQVFDTERIKAAILAALEQGLPLTDDCSAAEFAGMEVRLTPGSEENLKITVPSDLTLADAVLKRRERR